MERAAEYHSVPGAPGAGWHLAEKDERDHGALLYAERVTTAPPRVELSHYTQSVLFR